MKKSLIFSLSICILLLGVLLGLKFYDSRSREKAEEQARVVKEAELTRCKEIKESGLGSGEEIKVEGSVRDNIHLGMVLSCDGERLTIAGIDTNSYSPSEQEKDMSFNQTIDGTMWGNKGELLVDPTALSINSAFDFSDTISTKSDFNFDGYNDLSLLQSDGQGSMAVDSYLVFLFDPKIKRFVYSKELSAIQNIDTAPNDKTIISYQGEGNSSYSSKIYSWHDGQLVLTSAESCSADASVKAGKDGNFTYVLTEYTNGQPKVVKKETKRLGSGSCGDVWW